MSFDISLLVKHTYSPPHINAFHQVRAADVALWALLSFCLQRKRCLGSLRWQEEAVLYDLSTCILSCFSFRYDVRMAIDPVFATIKAKPEHLKMVENPLFDYVSTSYSHNFGYSGHLSGQAAHAMALVGSLIKNPQHSDND